ncbi:MAG: multidrug ABC transporter [Chloroflexi bacterium]|nr:multidrug ABC transporter [Chloroflexota bacterium]|tara:strand:- start:4706 stop:6496 length:1791 start_codon:yes stop_codon:yes gene_type:complete
MLNKRTAAWTTLNEEEIGAVWDFGAAKKLFPFLRGKLIVFSLAMVMMVFYTLTIVALPRIIGYVTDAFILTQDKSSLNQWGIALFAVVTINYVANVSYLKLLAQASQHVLLNLRMKMFDHLQNLSIPFFDKNEVGRIMSRIQNDVNQLQEFFPMLALTLGDLLSVVGITIVMLLMNVKLALYCFIVIPFLLFIIALWQTRAKAAFVKVRQAISVVNSRLQQNISGVRIVQSFNREERNAIIFDGVNDDHLQANIKAIKLSSALMPTVELVTAISLSLVIIIGGNMVLGEELQLGELIAFTLYVQRFFEPIRSLTMQYTEFQRTTTSAVRIFELLSVEPEVIYQESIKSNSKIEKSGKLKFDNVTMEYTKDRFALRNLDLTIESGEMIALVGPTGAGKTTIASLAARFYDPTEGNVFIDGLNLKELPREYLRQRLGMVLQEPFLYSLTVADNIKYNKNNASMEDIIKASKLAGGHEFISELSEGYNTILHERGMNLSLGQRQLISFARVLLADPEILILDEATANVDTFTEIKIQKALNTLLDNRTSIVIAHRLSTIRNADRIIVMDQGKILASGSHDELMNSSEFYQNLYNLNFTE